MVYSVFLNMDEKLVDINVVTGTHGSHVGGILGAHDPNDPQRDGIAPGVEVKLKIKNPEVFTNSSRLPMVTVVSKGLVDNDLFFDHLKISILADELQHLRPAAGRHGDRHGAV